jgi:NADPH-dependent 2,4-dienoyl-CoA reductase/sulfur reductase-like enzyme
MTVAIVGSGPAGTRAAEVLVRAGLRPVVIDEAPDNGGRIYQRQPKSFHRAGKQLYGFEARKAQALHACFDGLRDRIDYRPRTLVWNIRPGRLYTFGDRRYGEVAFDQVILCTGAMDRIVPLPGWTLPGVTTLGGAQIALKAQGCAIGTRVVFVGSGPLIYLVAWQYARAGVAVTVLDTSGFTEKARHLSGLLRGVGTFVKGLHYIAWLRVHGVRIFEGVTPVAIEGGEAVTGISFRDARGRSRRLDCDAVGMGWGLKPETQLADLAGVPFDYDAQQQLWLPQRDAAGRSPVPGVFLAGDGARIAGADVAELAGTRAALAVLEARGIATEASALARLDAAIARHAAFRRALDRTFPYPAALAAAVPDGTILCRCEAITAGELRRVARETALLPAPEVNRAKAFTRIGMGRCQGRVCGPPGAEILAAALGCPVADVGRLRGQPPVRPVPILAAQAVA